jgi:hypothetical protein
MQYPKTTFCLITSFIVYELLYFLLFMCWNCTSKVNSTSSLRKQLHIPLQQFTYHSYLITYYMEHSFSCEANQQTMQLDKKFPAFIKPKSYSTYSQVPANCPYSKQLIQSPRTPPSSWKSTLILSSHLRLGLPNGLFPSGFPTCPAHLIRLDFTTRTILVMGYRSFSSSICSFLHYPVTSSLLGPNNLLSTPFSNTLSLRSSLNVSDQVSHSYKTKGKIIILYILIYKILDSKLADKRFCTEW